MSPHPPVPRIPPQSPSPWHRTAAVAGPILSALGRRTTVRPGWLSWLLEAAFIGQPRSLRSRILARVMAGMIPPRGRDHPAATTPGGGL
ncbi:MAG: hypothetical protein RLY86_4416 [Pseudomonadota bacterium]|jgi:hypothetical protein